MGNLIQRFIELRDEMNQIFDDCEKSFKGQEDNKVILTDKCGHKLAVIPFKKALPYVHSYGVIYLSFGVTYMDSSLVVVCFDYASHFARFSVDSLSWDKLFEVADMIKEYNPKKATEYDYEGTRKFVAKLCKKSEI